MFTCMSSRAVHIETTNSMGTDSFILPLRRLISQKENVKMICTDNGTNFVQANIKLRKAFNEINHTKINNFLMKLEGEWITWRQNPSTTQHGRSLDAPNLLSLKYTQLIAESSWRKLK